MLSIKHVVNMANNACTPDRIHNNDIRSNSILDIVVLHSPKSKVIVGRFSL